jgi:hypothetical protein
MRAGAMGASQDSERSATGVASWWNVVSLLLMAFPLAETRTIVSYAGSSLGAGSNVGWYAVVVMNALLLALWLGAVKVAQRTRIQWLPLLVPFVSYGLVALLVYTLASNPR